MSSIPIWQQGFCVLFTNLVGQILYLSLLWSYLPKTVRISGFLTGGFEAIWPPNWGDFAKKECVTATSRSFKPGGLAIIWTVGNNNNVGGLERNSLILYKWGLESFILYMCGASKETPHSLCMGDHKQIPPCSTCGGVWKKIFTHYMRRAETEIPHPPFVGGL